MYRKNFHCKVNGCDNRFPGTKDYCSKHAKRLEKYGDPNYNVRKYGVKNCSISGCNKPHHSRGFCSTHYNQWRADTFPEKVKREWKESRVKKKKNHPERYKALRKAERIRNKPYYSKYFTEWQRKNPDKHKIYNDKSKLTHAEARLTQYKKKIEYLASCNNMTDEDYIKGIDYWSMSVKKRDGFTCQVCGSHSNLESAHLFAKSRYPTLSLNINNGITLCHTHHKELDRLNRFMIKVKKWK